MNERSLDNRDISAAETIEQRPRGNFWIEIIKFTLITLLIVVPFRIYIAQPFIVSGASMDETFADGEYLIVDQLSRRLEDPQRESVVIFKYPKDTSKFFIKRIIGLPGETVMGRDGIITIINEAHPDGLTLHEPYVSDENKKEDTFTTTLKDNEFFVMGDNRAGSFDSRAWGPVPAELIVGRPIMRLLPAHRLHVLPGDFSE